MDHPHELPGRRDSGQGRQQGPKGDGRQAGNHRGEDVRQLGEEVEPGVPEGEHMPEMGEAAAQDERREAPEHPSVLDVRPTSEIGHDDDRDGDVGCPNHHVGDDVDDHPVPGSAAKGDEEFVGAQGSTPSMAGQALTGSGTATPVRTVLTFVGMIYQFKSRKFRLLDYPWPAMERRPARRNVSGGAWLHQRRGPGRTSRLPRRMGREEAGPCCAGGV